MTGIWWSKVNVTFNCDVLKNFLVIIIITTIIIVIKNNYHKISPNFADFIDGLCCLVKRVCEEYFRILSFYAATSICEVVSTTSSLILLLLSFRWLSLHHLTMFSISHYIYYLSGKTWMETATWHLQRRHTTTWL